MTASFLNATYGMAADVVVGVVKVMGVVQGGVMLMGMVECVAVLYPVVMVAVGHTVVTGLLA